MIAFPVILSLALAVAVGLYAKMRIAHGRRIDVLSWSMLGISGVYGIIHCLIMLVPSMGHARYWLSMSVGDHIYHLLFTIVMVVFVVLGWSIASKPLQRSAQVVSSDLESHRRVLLLLAVALLFVAVLTQLLYTMPLGGPIAALDYSIAVRSGTNTIYNPFSALARMPGFVFISCAIFLGYMLSGRSKLWVYLIFLFALLFAAYTLYNWLARLYVVYIVGTIIIGGLLTRTNSPVRYVFPAIAMCVVGIFSIYKLSALFDFKAQASFLEFVTKEFSFVYTAFAAYIRLADPVHLHFGSLWGVPFYLLPASMLPDFVPSAVELNTVRITGFPKGVGGNTSGMPVDLLTLGLMQLGIAGLVITSCCFGAFLRLVQFAVDCISVRAIRITVGVYVGFMFGIHGLFYADPSVFLKEAFPTLAALLAVVIVFRGRQYKDAEAR